MQQQLRQARAEELAVAALLASQHHHHHHHHLHHHYHPSEHEPWLGQGQRLDFPSWRLDFLPTRGALGEDVCCSRGGKRGGPMPAEQLRTLMTMTPTTKMTMTMTRMRRLRRQLPGLGLGQREKIPR